MNFLFITIVFIITLQNVYSQPQGPICVQSATTVPRMMVELPDETDEASEGGGEENNITKWTDPDTGRDLVQCEMQSHHCFTLWHKDPETNNTVIMQQGCWATSGSLECGRTQCISNKKPTKAISSTKFCCCSGNLCNANFTDTYMAGADEFDDTVPATEHLEQAPTEHQTMIVWSASVCSLLFALAVAVLVYRVWQTRRSDLGDAKNSSHLDNAHLMSPGYTAGLYSVDHLKLISIVGQGRYGSVWKGVVNEQEVAVKIFPAHYRTYFYNERDIYCLPFMDCPALLSYYGCDERTNMEGHVEYLLVLSYAPNGCLQEYLTENVLDFPTFCKMSLSVAKGLAHLHTDIVKGDKVKPCVSHRDLNSRNILVKSDLSCCICDLGFAMKISGSKYYHNGEEQHAETKSINEVGTRRYMAPEVLEGSVNLRDCETSLKQIDVYALGLVLWELATRCSEFYQHGVQELPPYKLPFQQEIGLHPTLEEMQALVSRRKARPLFPLQWRDTAAARFVRDTAEDCWDQDAEARLTALCVEERLNELPLLRERHHRATMYSTSPTFNANQPNGNIINNNNHLNVSSGEHTTPSQTPTIINMNHVSKDGMCDVSDATVETLLSPTDPGEHTFKNSNQTAPYASNGLINQYRQATITAPLQPYQGRNPCLERNLMLPTDSTDNLQYSATLVDKSFKHSTHYRSNSNTTESQGLISHDYLGQNGYSGVIVGARPATPIPYVQNVVYDAHINGNLPKQHNTNTSNLEPIPPPPPPPRSKFRWTELRRLIDRKLFGRERLEPVPSEEEPKSNLISESILSKRNCEPMDTQVNLVGKHVNGFSNGVVTSVLQDDSCGGTSKRPSTLPLVSVKMTDETCKKSLTRSESNPIHNQKLSVSTKPVPELESKIKGSDSTSGISQLIRRQSALSKQQSLEQFNEVFSSTSDLSRLKDPSQRIKTPGDVPPSVRRTRGKAANVARFSLYDDRMMACDGGAAHWASVPDDIDITVETVASTTVLRVPDVESLKCNRDSVSSF